ncbi:hypothetical protein B0H13DRAFT_1868436 [Mycena leptocephala]|nr:hypothetical protein B0H13DRAFT_1868436 [Mycena leptocephala]
MTKVLILRSDEVCEGSTKDTPIEIRHTILLGIIKYIWHITHTPWSAEQKQAYAHRLQCTSTDGLSIHPIRSAYIMQYTGSLIGRQLKTLAQTNVFHVRGLVTDDQFTALKAAGELAALLWVPEIRNLAEYRVAVANVLDIVATIDPSKIITKIKYHLLVHTDDDVVEFGPLIGLATEIFESFNGRFKAPSDRWMVAMRRRRKVGTCGQWCPILYGGTSILQKLPGWTEPSSMKHGIVSSHTEMFTAEPSFTGDFKLVPLKRAEGARKSYPLESTSAARAVNYGMYTPESMWNKCSYVISGSLDECMVSSWVFAASPTAADLSTIAGRISDILTDSASPVLAVLEQFLVLSVRDKIFGMPVLTRRDSEVTYSIVPAKRYWTVFAHAGASRIRPDRKLHCSVHSTASSSTCTCSTMLTCYAQLSARLSCTYPLFSDRQAKHSELATQLREKVAIRKAAAVNKRKRPEDDDEVDARPRKARKKTPKNRTPNVVVLPPAGSMVANRPRRTILPTEQAKAAQQVEQSEEEAVDNCSDDSDDGYIDSDEDYSD